MKQFLVISGFLAVFLCLTPVTEARSYGIRLDDSGYYGTHAWDERTEIDRARRWYHRNYDIEYYLSKEYFYVHPDYAKKAQLHPVYRSLYYEPIPSDPYLLRYSQRPEDTNFHLDYRYQPRHDRNGVRCSNYTYSRPNRTVAPFGYRCQ